MAKKKDDAITQGVAVSSNKDSGTATYNKAEFADLVKQIKDLIRRHQEAAWKHINNELVSLYWEIGEEIVRRQIGKGWGNTVVDDLAKELQNEFPGERGYSARNLWRMRTFYIEYSPANFLPLAVAESEIPTESAKMPLLLSDISWTHNYVIVEKCKDNLEREFYVKMTKRYGWSKDVLINNIENKAFEKYLINQANFDETVPEKYKLQAKLAVKDDYNFDFIEMGIEHSEKELETGIVKNIRGFLREMGGDFSFIGNQHHLDVAGDDYYIDLLLFHRRLRCLIAIDLKIGEFKPEYAGKMQFYLNALDETLKNPEENPSIGIIICKSKNRTRVEYTLKTTNKPIGVATYSYFQALPENLKDLLPTSEDIADIIHKFEDGEL